MKTLELNENQAFLLMLSIDAMVQETEKEIRNFGKKLAKNVGDCEAIMNAVNQLQDERSTLLHLKEQLLSK